ncbi:hypothetical protein [Pseudolysinimonas sp.]
MEWTILGPVAIAVLGGAVGSAITAGAGLAQSSRATREAASSALWNYHRNLLGFATRKYNELGFDEDRARMAGASFKQVAAAWEAAYPWASYLRPTARYDLFRNANIEIGQIPWDSPDDLLTAVNSAQDAAERLERELERVFPRRFADRVRSLFPSRYPGAPRKVAKKFA